MHVAGCRMAADVAGPLPAFAIGHVSHGEMAAASTALDPAPADRAPGVPGRLGNRPGGIVAFVLRFEVRRERPGVALGKQHHPGPLPAGLRDQPHGIVDPRFFGSRPVDRRLGDGEPECRGRTTGRRAHAVTSADKTVTSSAPALHPGISVSGQALTAQSQARSAFSSMWSPGLRLTSASPR